MTSCTILMYHAVDRPQSSVEAALCCDPETFAAQMDYLDRHGYAVVPLARLVRAARAEDDLPDRSVVVTLDDGLNCTCETALPILERRGFPATVFVVSGLLGRTNEWLHTAGFPKRSMLSVAGLRRLAAAGLDVGSHTVSHPWLSKLPANVARAEVRDSKARLEDIIGRPVVHFAYPYGDYTAAVRDFVVEAGYVAACSTRWGRHHAKKQLFALRRVEINGQDSLLQFAVKLRIGTHHVPPLPEARSLVRQGLEAIGCLHERYPEDR
jgi:peptidoglycan/xylan/chitin deacetylase (PgdA/CDA1 family)